MAGQIRSLSRIAELPIEKQRALAGGEQLEVWKPAQGAAVKKTIRSMSFPELAAVIKNGRILTAAEQASSIVAKPTRTPKKSKVVNIRIDPETLHIAQMRAQSRGKHLEDFLRAIILTAIRDN